MENFDIKVKMISDCYKVLGLLKNSMGKEAYSIGI